MSPQSSFWFLFLLLLFAPSLLDDGIGSLEILQDRRARSHHGGDDDTHDDVSQDRAGQPQQRNKSGLARPVFVSDRHFPQIYLMF